MAPPHHGHALLQPAPRPARAFPSFFSATECSRPSSTSPVPPFCPPPRCTHSLPGFLPNSGRPATLSLASVRPRLSAVRSSSYPAVVLLGALPDRSDGEISQALARVRPPVTTASRKLEKMLSKIVCNCLQKEVAEWQASPPGGFNYKVSDNLQRWVVEVSGAEGTLYAGEKYELQVDFLQHYPMEAPQVIFMNPAPMQPHIYSNGHICLGSNPSPGCRTEAGEEGARGSNAICGS